jgi:hypothetical protein
LSRPVFCLIFSSMFGDQSRQPIAMTRAIHWRWVGSASMGWLVLAAALALVPAEADAGCNHPWVRGSNSDRPLIDLELLEPSHAPSIPEPGSRPPVDHRGPCASGSCSDAPNTPTSSTVELSPQGDRWCPRPANVTPSVLASGWHSCAEILAIPAGVRFRLERPPRPLVACRPSPRQARPLSRVEPWPFMAA